MSIKKPSEADIVKACLRFFTLLGWPAWRFNCGGMYKLGQFVRFNTARGCSDILFVAPQPLPGAYAAFGACECKVEGSGLTARQSEFKAVVEAAGGIHITARGVGDLTRELAALGLIPKR